VKDILNLLLTFLKIGGFVLGGGYAMIPAIRRETVQRRHWLGEEELADCIAICQSLPGAFAINTAIFIGRKVKGFPGALVACFAMVFPAFLAILLILQFLGQVEENPYVIGAIEGIMAASIALILVTTYEMGKTALKTKTSYLIAAGSLLLIVAFDVSAVLVILLGALLGYLVHLYHTRKRGRES
jgi:chromate transporter